VLAQHRDSECFACDPYWEPSQAPAAFHCLFNGRSGEIWDDLIYDYWLVVSTHLKKIFETTNQTITLEVGTPPV